MEYKNTGRIKGEASASTVRELAYIKKYLVRVIRGKRYSHVFILGAMPLYVLKKL